MTLSDTVSLVHENHYNTALERAEDSIQNLIQPVPILFQNRNTDRARKQTDSGTSVS